MPLPEIQLDDRRFDELFREAKRRIPRYTPDWTDHSESDPGITLVQLFAWLTEMVLYRLNRVPEKNYLKFLELIGIQLEPPTPAKAELTFKLTTKDLPEAKLIPQGTKVSLAEQVDGGPVIFETDDNLYAVGADLVALQSYDGAQYQLLTELNRVKGKFFFPFGPRPQKEGALYLGFDRAFPSGRHRMMVHVHTADLMEEGNAIGAETVEPAPPVVASWEYWAGESFKWNRLTIMADETRNLTRSGFVQFEVPPSPAFQKIKLGLLQREQDEPLFWIRYRIDQVLGQGYEIPPRLEDVLLNTVTATNAVTVHDELLGPSTGLPNQEFRLSNIPVLPQTLSPEMERGEWFQPGTLVLEVDEGEGFQPWMQVRDFSNSKREDKHYTLDFATGKITFGNGEQGKIPAIIFQPQRIGLPTLAAGSAGGDDQALANIKASEYRWGGGARGNAGANKITSLESSVPYVENVTNHRPSDGGRDEEALDDAKLRAPQAIRSRSRAVTAEDFEFLATQAPSTRIRRAKTLPLRHPSFEAMRPEGTGLPAVTIPIPGVVTVIVVPDAGDLDPKPMPTEETLQRVASWLKQHALVTTEIYVAAPKYRKVEIEARVIARPDASSGILAETLNAELLNYFHPLKGGSDGTGWGFGEKIYFSDVYRQILSTEGVARLEADALKIFIDEKPVKACSDIELAENELVYSEKHSIAVNYA